METGTPIRNAERFGVCEKLSCGSAAGCLSWVAYFHISIEKSMLLKKAIRSASSDRRQQTSITPTSSAMFSSVSFVRPRGDSAFVRPRGDSGFVTVTQSVP